MKYLPYLILLFLAGCNGCDDDNLIPEPMGEECTQSFGCKGVADCDNGYCDCPNESEQIARGFCIQRPDGVNFITYDRFPGLLDTNVVFFSEEPFDQTWEEGDDVIRFIPSKVHDRDPSPLTIGGLNDAVALIWPGDFVTPVDSIWIFEFYDKSHNPYSYREGEWLCRGKSFVGKFVDRNTIKGNIMVNICNTQGTTPMPEGLEGRLYPVTYTRWEP